MLMLIGGGNYCLAQETALLKFTKACGGKGTDNKGGAWTVASDATEVKDGTFDTRGIHYGTSKKPVSYIKVSTKAYSDKPITKIVVHAATASRVDASVKCEVGGAAFGVAQKLTSTDNAYTFEDNASGDILVSVYKPESKKGALYILSVEITYSTANLETTTLTLTAPDSPISIGGTYTSTPTLKAGEQTLSDKTITWSSDNDKVATVDAATGTVTGVAAGKANITAKFAGDDTYKTSKASYEIIVKDAPSLSFPQTSYTVEMSDVFSTPKLDGLPEGVTPAYTSSKEEVATVNAATGEVKIVGVGKTTITVTSPNTDIYEEATASYELNVKAAIYKVEFDFTSNNWGLPTNYKKEEASYTNEAGYTITFGKSNGGHKIMGNDPNRNLIFGKEGATLSLPAFPFAVSKIKVFGNNGASKYTTQNFFVGGEAVSTETTSAITDHIYEIAEAFQAAGNIYTLKVTNDNNTQITKIVVYAKDETVAGAINIATEEGFGTFYTDKNYVLPQGLTAFGYTSINDNNILTKSVEYVAGDIVPANTAVVVKGAKGSYNYYNTEEAATKTIEKNLLKGVTTDTRFEASSGVKRYILTRADDGILAFYRTNTGNINVKANRAYLEVPTAMAVASFSLEGTATGINNVVTTAAKQGIYTISGVRLNATTTKELPAGIYIVDGKKVIVK